MSISLTEAQGETIPLKTGPSSTTTSQVELAGRTFGTRYFLLSSIFASIIPIVQLCLGIIYKNECQIEQRIPTYMIVAGVFGLILAALAILLSITFLCIVSDSAVLTILGSFGVLCNVFITLLISLFLFIWLIIGCVWTFRVRSDVQFKDSSRINYCNPVLYRGTVAILIITLLWPFIQCCLSCFRQCISRKQN